MTVVSNPVESGLVRDLAHPGGNVTGLSVMGSEVATKRLQLLKDLIPTLGRVSVVWNPSAGSHAKAVQDLKMAAASLLIQLNFVAVEAPEEIETAVSSAVRARAQALCVLADPQLIVHRRTFIRLASLARLPVIYSERSFVDEGGLISYGTDWVDQWYRAAGYVDKILKGAKAGDLPIEQPTQFELIVNLKTARAIGVAVPHSILAAANEVLQ
jgi:putative ABC transport system substrate-binding protein